MFCDLNYNFSFFSVHRHSAVLRGPVSIIYLANYLLIIIRMRFFIIIKTSVGLSNIDLLRLEVQYDLLPGHA